MRFSGITTIRGASKTRVAQAAEKKRAEVASFPQAVAFKTTIPRTGEHLVIFLTDDDAVAFKAARNKQTPMMANLVENMAERGSSRIESTEMGLSQMIDEGVLQDFMVAHPKRDVAGDPHERIDCNRYLFRPNTWLGLLVDGVRQLFSTSQVVLPRGKFDFYYDLKNPVHAYVIQDDEP